MQPSHRLAVVPGCPQAEETLVGLANGERSRAGFRAVLNISIVSINGTYVIILKWCCSHVRDVEVNRGDVVFAIRFEQINSERWLDRVIDGGQSCGTWIGRPRSVGLEMAATPINYADTDADDNKKSDESRK